MPRIPSKIVNKCKACEGTGKASNDWACFPCQGTGVDVGYSDKCDGCGKPVQNRTRTDGKWTNWCKACYEKVFLPAHQKRVGK